MAESFPRWRSRGNSDSQFLAVESSNDNPRTKGGLSDVERGPLPQHLAAVTELGERDLSAVGGADRWCSSYSLPPFLFSCYCDEETGELTYCDVIWEGESGS